MFVHTYIWLEYTVVENVILISYVFIKAIMHHKVLRQKAVGIIAPKDSTYFFFNN